MKQLLQTPDLDVPISTDRKDRFFLSLGNIKNILSRSEEPWETAVQYYYIVLRSGHRRHICNKNAKAAAIAAEFNTVYKAELPAFVYSSFDFFHQWMQDLEMRMPRETPDDIKNQIKLKYLDEGIDTISEILDNLNDIVNENRTAAMLQSVPYRLCMKQLMAQTTLMVDMSTC